MFKDKYTNRPKTVPEKNSGGSKTEQSGYIPPNVQIERMIQAGMRLNDSRMGYEFGADEEVPHDYVDPTRNPNFDLADASSLGNTAADNIKKSYDAAEKIEAEKKAANAAKGSPADKADEGEKES